MPHTENTTIKSMDAIVALCRRRGFIFQSSEIYGGINGFWDYGPLGVDLKRNLKEAWWHDVVHCPPDGPDGKPLEIVGLDTTIIMNPKVWEASGHVGGFNDPMVDCRQTKARYRADQLIVIFGKDADREIGVAFQADSAQKAEHILGCLKKTGAPPADFIDKASMALFRQFDSIAWGTYKDFSQLTEAERAITFAPGVGNKPGTLTEPRMFNLMYDVYNGPIRDEQNKTYLRPETAQGIFANFRNVLDTTRVKIPFGIAQIGKAFRNEVTPRNFTFRSREFEQMEIEFFVHPSAARSWYSYWCEARFRWWQSVGLASDNLALRAHGQDELSHYAKGGHGTSDVEYRFPFTAPGFGELEGIAHRTDFDLRRHAECSGMGDKLKYFDQGINEHYFPQVIEPSAGADRGMLALLCEAYTPDPKRPSKVYLNFTPRMAPIKAAVFPLVAKDGMPEVAEKLYLELRRQYAVQFDVKQNIGKRYARMDEAGTPYCFTIDGQTLEDQTVTVRDRDTTAQQRICINNVSGYLAQKSV